MRIEKLRLATLAMLGLVGAAPPGHAGLVLDLTGGGTQSSCGGSCGSGTTFGWSFTVNSPIRVDGIGVWDFFGSSFPAATEAGLWSGTGALLERESITSASTPVASANTSGQWLFESFAPITLAPGDYVIGNVFTIDQPLIAFNASITAISQITLTGGRAGAPGVGLTEPLVSFSPPVYGPTLETVAVPEPGTLSLLGLGFAGIFGGRAKRWRETARRLFRESTI
jgi:hypothetical protein